MFLITDQRQNLTFKKKKVSKAAADKGRDTFLFWNSALLLLQQNHDLQPEPPNQLTDLLEPDVMFQRQ